MNKIEDIEKLRGLACILVFIQHIVWICPYRFLYDVTPDFMKIGSGGVQIFFAISGFVITLSLRNKLAGIVGDTFLERLHAAGDRIKAFYKKRFFRIIPVMMLVWVMLGIFLFCTESGTRWMTGFFRLPCEIISGIYPYVIEKHDVAERVHFAGSGPFWTLAVEFQFYIIWPIVMLMCKNDNARTLTPLICGFIALFLAQPITTSFLKFRYYALYNNVAELFFGAFFAMIYDQTKNYTAKHKAAVTFSMLIAFFAVWIFPNVLPQNDFCMHSAVSIAAIFMLVTAVFENGGFSIPLVTPFLSFLGRRSYSFYAVQLTTASIAAWFVNSIYFPIDNATPFLQFLFFVIVLCFVTEIVYNFVEKPSRKLGLN